MPQILIVRLPAPGQTDAEWLTVDDAGLAQGVVHRGPLAEAAATAPPEARVIALASGTEVLIAAAQLPPGSGAKLARAVPFALEEQLSEDLDTLCFAIGKRAADGTTPVAVVARTALEGWLAALRGAGLEPAALHADLAWLPDNPGQTVLWLEGERLAVRRPGALPLMVEAAPLADALEACGLICDPAAAQAEPQPLANAILYLGREDWERVQNEVESLLPRFETLKVQLLADGPLPWLARSLTTRGAVNLLQGEFARTPPLAKRLHEWRVAAILAAALLVVHIGAQSIELAHAHRERARLDAQIGQLYSTAMPGEPMQDARRQMQQRLQLIRASATGPQRFLHAMQALATAVAASPQTTIESFAFRDGSMDLTVAAHAIDGLSQLAGSLGRQGFAAEIQSSTPTKDGIEGHLRIRSTEPRR